VPDVDKELEEIKKLISGDDSDARPSSNALVPSRSGPGVPGAPKSPENKELTVRPAAQKPAPAQPRQVPAQSRPVQAQPKPVPAQPRQGPQGVQRTAGGKALGVPSAPGGRPPGPANKTEPPGISDGAARVRSYNISDSGKITKKPDKEQVPDTGSDKFNIDFDFDGEYRDVPEDKPLRRRRERRTGCVGGILYSAFIICISLVLASLLWLATVDVLGFNSVDEQVNITVPAGFTIEDVTDMLFDAGIIRYKFLFDLYAGYSHAEEKITPGAYILNRNLDYRSIVQGMTARAGVRVETTVTIPEGFTLAQICALLEDYGIITSAGDFWDVAANHDFNYHFLDKETLGDKLRLEGFLFPDTHNFYLDSTPVQVLNRLLREFDRRFSDVYIERAEAMGYSIRDIINVAAMIEREAGSDQERARIAAVIYNRLESSSFPHLQIDATIHYAIAGTDIPFSIELDDPYNTYICEGLPPGPIANPGLHSIRAALYPDATNEYYYALNREGTHNFFRTYEQHQAFVKSDQYGGR